MNTLATLAKNNALAPFLTQNAPLKSLTSFEIGGNAAILLAPRTHAELVNALNILTKGDENGNAYKYTVLGGGSNVVISDTGLQIVLLTTNLKNITFSAQNLCTPQNARTTDARPADDAETVHIVCEAGVLIDDLVRFCEENSFTGLETFAGLPGTVGGAVFMNARCYDVEVADVLLDATLIQKSTNKEFFYKMDKKDFAYKKSPFQDGKSIIYSATFVAKKCTSQEKIKLKSDFYRKDREQKGHFTKPSAGSVFKNNRAFGEPSGKIIDSLGLKGFAIGGAQIAPWHGNLIINTGGASADNVKRLVSHVISVVKEKRGFELEPEIIFLD